MRRHILVAVLGVVVAGAVLTLAPTRGNAIVNRIEVKELELGYRVGDGGLRVRLTLASREALEHEAADPVEVERLLQLAQAFAGPRARMYAEVEQSRLRAIQVAID